MLKATDFSRSFLTFCIDAQRRRPPTATHELVVSLNNCRFPIECRCLVTEKSSRRQEEFVLGASCKTEHVGVDREIWMHPNADFAPIFSRRQFLHLKTYEKVGKTSPFFDRSLGVQTERHTGLVDDAFESLRIDLCEVDAETLRATEDIIAATLNNDRLVGRTCIESERYTVDLEYPIKTTNASERDGVYQTDTGPVLLPDLSRDMDSMIEGFELAYSAFNDPTWIEFLVRVPTEIAPCVSVYHYSQPCRFAARNQMLRLVPHDELKRDAAAEQKLRPHVLRSQRTVDASVE